MCRHFPVSFCYFCFLTALSLDLASSFYVLFCCFITSNCVFLPSALSCVFKLCPFLKSSSGRLCVTQRVQTLSLSTFIYLFLFAAFNCLIFACFLFSCFCPSCPTTKCLKSLFEGFTTFAWSSFPHSDPSLITDAVPFSFIQSFIHSFIHLFSCKVKNRQTFLPSGMLETTLLCVLLLSNANVLSAPMLTPCFLFMPTRGVVLSSERLKCSDSKTRGGKQRGDRVPSVVSWV